MKQAKTIYAQISKLFGDNDIPSIESIKRIQLDAYKAGVLFGAEMGIGGHDMTSVKRHIKDFSIHDL